MGAIYQADIFCDDCAREIKRDLRESGFVSKLNAEGADIHDEYTYDSDDYPKYCDEQSEADCPQHCAGCTEFLENALTSDGYDYVKDAVKEGMKDGCADSIACILWAPYYGIEVKCSCDLCDCYGQGACETHNDDCPHCDSGDDCPCIEGI